MTKMLKAISALATMLLLTASLLNAQSTSELFSQAKALAKEKRYEQAQVILRDILSKEDNGDVRFYLGLIYSWNGIS